jgi:hypothetical protein
LRAFDARREAIDRVVVDDGALEADEPSQTDNPILSAVLANAAEFTALCGFSPLNFQRLYQPLAGILSHGRRGRGPGIGPADSFFLFLHWLKTGSAIAAIAAGFHVRKQTLYRHTRLLIERVSENLIARYVTLHANLPLPGRVILPEATVSNDWG